MQQPQGQPSHQGHRGAGTEADGACSGTQGSSPPPPVQCQGLTVPSAILSSSSSCPALRWSHTTLLLFTAVAMGCGFSPFPPVASLFLPEASLEFCFPFLPAPPSAVSGLLVLPLVMRHHWTLVSAGRRPLGRVDAGTSTAVLLQCKIRRRRCFWRCTAAVLGCTQVPPSVQQLCPCVARPETPLGGHPRTGDSEAAGAGAAGRVLP